MPQAERESLRDATPEEVALVETWAELTKTLSIYPETNHRVKAQLDGFLQNVTEAAGPGGSVRILWQREQLTIGDGSLDLTDDPRFAWLKERLDKCVLAGVRFTPPVPAESVVDFTKDLIKNSTGRRADPRFEDLWTRGYEQMALIELRFTGAPVEHSEPPAGREGAGPGGSTELDDRGKELAALLECSEDISKKLAELTAQLERIGDTELMRLTQMDVIGRIVDMLPLDVLANEHALVRETSRILDQMVKAAQDWDGTSKMLDTALTHMMSSIGRKMFSREGPREDAPEDAEETESREQGRANDEKVVDDVDALLLEVGLLPVADNPARLLADVDLQDEQMWVYLHYLINAAEPERSAAVHSRVVDLLTDPRPEVLAVLRGRLETFVTKGMAGRIMGPLRETGLVHELLEPAAAWFPKGFVQLLDAIDAECAEDLDLLHELVSSVGYERLVAAKQMLQHEGGVTSADRESVILARPSPDFLPLVHQCLEEAGERIRHDVAWFLLNAGMKEREVTPLRLVDDVDTLPFEYLLALASRNGDGEFDALMPDLVANALVDFVEQAKGDAALLQKRVYAVHNLRYFCTPASKQFLQRLSRGKWFGLGREPAQLRQAAAAALEAYE